MEGYQPSISDNEDNDVPITYGLVIHKLEEVQPKNKTPEQQTLPDVVDDTPPEKQRPPDCVRDHPLPQEEIDAYIAKNKAKVGVTNLSFIADLQWTLTLLAIHSHVHVHYMSLLLMMPLPKMAGFRSFIHCATQSTHRKTVSD
ncbi:unnamed protein product [Heligmosomoides polygyrus]|uniref:U-box domain-containing protein n=1 Tax=Heligmosomoides polygyrus TaxID=6339 RepID=A0A183GH84_HELPZ|nr:unnamed protein product [Heligmosomoides polygyrus]